MTLPICAICGATFERAGKSRRKTCSASCRSALAWHTNPEKRIAGISESKQRPEAQAILARRNEERWADPAEHEKLSRENRERWAAGQPERAASIRGAWTPELRAHLSAIKKDLWAEKSAEERRRHVEPALRARAEGGGDGAVACKTLAKGQDASTGR